MGFRIEDGYGSGRFAKVDSAHRIEVAATSIPIIADAARNGYAFSIVGHRTLASSNEENVLILRNDNPSLDVHLQSIRMSVKTSTDVELKFYFGATYTSGGTAITPVQLNRGSARSSGVIGYENSGTALVVGTTAAEEFSNQRVATTGSTFLTSEGAIILGPGDTYLMTGKGASGDLIEGVIFMFEAVHVATT